MSLVISDAHLLELSVEDAPHMLPAHLLLFNVCNHPGVVVNPTPQMGNPRLREENLPAQRSFTTNQWWSQGSSSSRSHGPCS